MSRTVVIGFDGSESGEDAVALGMRLARATGDAPLVAAVYPEEYESGMGRVDAEYVGFMREQADQMLARARRLIGDDEAVMYRRVGSSSAAHGLDELAEQEGATCVVIGSTRHAPLRRLFIGSTGERLLHGAGCPVAVAPRWLRDRTWSAIRTVGCAFIDTPDGREALHGAAELARRIPARLRVYSVVGRVAEFSPLAKTDSELAFAAQMRESFQAALDRGLAELPEQLEATGELLEGDPVDVLAALDERDVDLLVCGSRSYGPVRRVLLGGVASQLVRRAACPVLVVPRGAGDSLAASTSPAPAADSA
jgi:nucleotide-binding universal stress UspA family protein